MKFAEFKQHIENTYNALFHASKCRCMIYNCFGKSITIDCWLAEKTEECPNNIPANDMFHISFIIDLPKDWQDDDDMPDNMTMKAYAKDIKIKPENPMFYCDRKTISFRKTSGNAEKLMQTFSNFVIRLFKAVMEEYKNDNLLAYDMQLIQKKNYFI